MDYYSDVGSSTTNNTYPPLPHEVARGHREATRNRPPVIGNEACNGLTWNHVWLVPVFILFVICSCAATGSKMHHSCYLNVSAGNNVYMTGPVDLCFGLHGYRDNLANITVRGNGYNITKVIDDATGHVYREGLDWSWAPVTRGFAMTPFFAVYSGLMLACWQTLSCFTLLHTVLAVLSVIPVAINLSVFLGVRKNLIQQVALARKMSRPGVDVSPVGALAWLQLLACFLMFLSIPISVYIDKKEPVFAPSYRAGHAVEPREDRLPRRYEDHHRFGYYTETQAGRDVTSPVSIPSSIYRPPGSSVYPHDATSIRGW